MGASCDELVVIQVARLDPLKDHCTALRSIERAAQICPQVRLILVGDGPERPLIEKEIAARRLEGIVRLLGQRSDVPQLLAGADLFLLTSISEGIPLTVIEAMAAGLPVVATKVGGLSEVVEEGRTGRLALAGDDSALAESILQLMQDPSLRQQMGRRGQERAQAMFSERTMHADYLHLYREMLWG